MPVLSGGIKIKEIKTMKKRVTATLLGILMPGMTVNVQAAEENSLVVGNMGNSIKAAVVFLASAMGY